MKRYRKTTVQMHQDGFGPYNPAINVKDPPFPDIYEVQREFNCSLEQAEKATITAFDVAADRFWEKVQPLADEILAPHFGTVSAYSEGRSNGWVVVHGLPEVESWDAVALGKWRSYEKAVQSLIAELCNWDRVKEDIAANGWAEEGDNE